MRQHQGSSAKTPMQTVLEQCRLQGENDRSLFTWNTNIRRSTRLAKSEFRLRQMIFSPPPAKPFDSEGCWALTTLPSLPHGHIGGL